MIPRVPWRVRSWIQWTITRFSLIKVTLMTVLGWISVGQRFIERQLLTSRKRDKAQSRAVVIEAESLEKIELLTHALLPSSFSLYGNVLTPHQSVNTVSYTTTPQFVKVQTANVPATLTNFTAPFNPSFSLFDPSLGTLTSVNITSNTYLSSVIQSQNLSQTTPASITASISGAYSITGFPSALNGSLENYSATETAAAYKGEDTFTGPSTVNFNGLSTSSSQTQTLTDTADLAFFTASAGHSTVTPNLQMNATAGASAPNGNIQTSVVTNGLGTVSVSYTYTPPAPEAVSLVRYGIHHQQTQLQLTFSGYVDPAQANTPNTYRVIVPNKSGSFTGPGVTYIAIAQATFDPNTNSVTLIPARRLNVHYQFQLQVKLPVNNGNVIVLDFGGKQSLGGFNNHHGQFVPFAAKAHH